MWKCPKFTLCQPCMSNPLTAKLVGLRVGKQHNLVAVQEFSSNWWADKLRNRPHRLTFELTQHGQDNPPCGFSTAFATKFEAYCNFIFPLKPFACIFDLSYTSFALVSLCFTFPRQPLPSSTQDLRVFATAECREYFMRGCKLRTCSKNHLKPVQYFLGARQRSAAWVTAGCS